MADISRLHRWSTLPPKAIEASGKEELPMITFVRTAVVAPGKMADAMTLDQQWTKLAKNKFDLDVHVNTPIGGNPSRKAWNGVRLASTDVYGLAFKQP